MKIAITTKIESEVNDVEVWLEQDHSGAVLLRGRRTGEQAKTLVGMYNSLEKASVYTASIKSLGFEVEN